MAKADQSGEPVRGVKGSSDLCLLPYWDHVQQPAIGVAHLLYNVALRLVATLKGKV